MRYWIRRGDDEIVFESNVDFVDICSGHSGDNDYGYEKDKIRIYNDEKSYVGLWHKTGSDKDVPSGEGVSEAS